VYEGESRMDTLLEKCSKEYVDVNNIVAREQYKEIYGIESGINKAGLLFHSKGNIAINSNDFGRMWSLQNKVGGVYLMKNKQTTLTEDIIRKTEELAGAEDLRDQIVVCTDIAEKTLELLKIMKKVDENDYRKNIVHLFFQAIKRNYAKKKFNRKQINLLIEMITISTGKTVTEEEYLQYDEELYLNRLDSFAEVE